MLLLTDTDLPSTFIANNTGLSSYPDTELSKIRSFDKRTEIFNILHSESPSHYERLWLVGFLRFVGYSFDETCSIIHEENSWVGYDPIMTYNQVRSVFKGSRTTTLHRKGISSPFITWFKHDEWEKRYGKRLCTIHYVSCEECPDNVPGQACKGRV